MVDCMQISLFNGEIAVRENFEGTQTVRITRVYCTSVSHPRVAHCQPLSQVENGWKLLLLVPKECIK